MSEINEGASDNIRSFLTAERLLLDLSRKEWGNHYEGLRDYVRWLLKKREMDKMLKQLEEHWKAFDDSLERKTQIGELSKAQATLQKGDAIWWRAMEEIRGASLYIALSRVIERNLLAALKNQPAKTNETLNELQREIESELVAKLRECLSDIPPKEQIENEHDDWLLLSQTGLANAYGADEPEYSLNLLKEPNPEYEGR